MPPILESCQRLWARLEAWAGRAELWQVALVAAVAAVLLLPALPALALLGLGVGVYLFSVAWVREFRCLIGLGDHAFPGRHDKLIWAILLIIIPPAGVLLFRPYREARWPEAKPSRGATAFDLD